MMSEGLNNFFEHFDKVENEKIYQKEKTLEAILIDMAEHWNTNLRQLILRRNICRQNRHLQKSRIRYL